MIHISRLLFVGLFGGLVRSAVTFFNFVFEKGLYINHFYLKIVCDLCD